MPRGLILWVLIASHQNSVTSRMHGSVSIDFQPFFASTALSRLNAGASTSQLSVHMVQNQENHELFIDMPPTYPHFTLPSACSFFEIATISAQVLGSWLSFSRSVL